MKPVAKHARQRGAFTIVELLTVMSIIVILIGLLVPALNKVKRFATDVKQKAQFHSIEAALELFASQFGGYPPSDALDSTGAEYDGSLKLCEALMGKDLLGFHPDSVFRRDGMAPRILADGTQDVVALYTQSTMAARPGAFLPLENANAYPLGELYKNPGTLEADGEKQYTLCDVYGRVTNIRTGKKVGMPVLYYRANTSRQSNDLENPDDPDNIYNWRDNAELLRLGKPFDPTGLPHRLLSFPGDPRGTPAEPEGKRFYWNIRNDQVSIMRPFRADSYILISAGWDSEYGTADDICNFDWTFRDQLK